MVGDGKRDDPNAPFQSVVFKQNGEIVNQNEEDYEYLNGEIVGQSKLKNGSIYLLMRSMVVDEICIMTFDKQGKVEILGIFQSFEERIAQGIFTQY